MTDGVTIDDPAMVQRAYTALFDRFKTNTDIMWRIVALVLASEAALFVGITKAEGAFQFVIGVALLLASLVGMTSLRNIDRIVLLDRMMLDDYEKRLLSDKFRLFHASRSLQRMEEASNRLDLDQFKRRRIRFGAQRTWFDKAADVLGQSSVIWTLAILTIGLVGFGIGVHAAVETVWIQVLVIGVVSVVVYAAMLAAHGWLRRA